MTAPAAPQPAHQPPPATQGLPAPQAPRPRPGGVTFAGTLAVVLAALGILGGLVVMSMGVAFASSVPIIGFLGAFAVAIGMMVVAMGVLGLVAGVMALQGASWARWTLVVLYVLGALQGLAGMGAGVPLLLVPLNGVAVWLLVNEDASAWYASRQVRTLTPR